MKYQDYTKIKKGVGQMFKFEYGKMPSDELNKTISNIDNITHKSHSLKMKDNKELVQNILKPVAVIEKIVKKEKKESIGSKNNKKEKKVKVGFMV